MLDWLADKHGHAGAADAAVMTDVFHRHQQRMTTGNEQEQKRKFDLVREPGGQRMRFEMIDGEEGLVVGEGQRLGRHHPHHYTADQAGPAGGGNAVELGEIEAGDGQGVLDQPVDALEMGARGDFRHHAAEAAMLGQLAINHIGQDLAERSIARGAADGWRFDDGDGRFVAACFNSHHTHACLLASAVHLR